VPVNLNLNRGCISVNGWFYDLRSDESGTTLDRYQGENFVNRQTYAAFHRPAAGTVTWDEGVAFAAAMQTRNAWVNNEPTLAGSWFEDSVTGNDRFTFETTVNGVPTQFVFVTEACPASEARARVITRGREENILAPGRIVASRPKTSSGARP
jgi:hypothetical protein